MNYKRANEVFFDYEFTRLFRSLESMSVECVNFIPFMFPLLQMRCFEQCRLLRRMKFQKISGKLIYINMKASSNNSKTSSESR
jgi:hypothetical protein